MSGPRVIPVGADGLANIIRSKELTPGNLFGLEFDEHIYCLLTGDMGTAHQVLQPLQESGSDRRVEVYSTTDHIMRTLGFDPDAFVPDDKKRIMEYTCEGTLNKFFNSNPQELAQGYLRMALAFCNALRQFNPRIPEGGLAAVLTGYNRGYLEFSTEFSPEGALLLPTIKVFPGAVKTMYDYGRLPGQPQKD